MAKERIIPKSDLEHLGDLLSYFILQRERARPVPSLKRTIRDLRMLLFRIIINYYLPLSPLKDEQFFDELAEFLTGIQDEMCEEGVDLKYCDYCIDKILSSFEYAGKIKYGTRAKLTKKELASNLAILSHFSLNLRPLIRLVEPNYSPSPQQ